MKIEDVTHCIPIGPGTNGYLNEDIYVSREPWDISEKKLYEIRQWGNYTILDSGAGYKVKRIVMNTNKSISLQYHLHRAEHWIFIRGVAKVEIEGVETILYPSESVYISTGEKHQCTNIGTIPLEFIEVQTGEYLEEDDIVRLNEKSNTLETHSITLTERLE